MASSLVTPNLWGWERKKSWRKGWKIDQYNYNYFHTHKQELKLWGRWSQKLFSQRGKKGVKAFPHCIGAALLWFTLDTWRLKKSLLRRRTKVQHPLKKKKAISTTYKLEILRRIYLLLYTFNYYWSMFII